MTGSLGVYIYHHGHHDVRFYAADDDGEEANDGDGEDADDGDGDGVDTDDFVTWLRSK